MNKKRLIAFAMVVIAVMNLGFTTEAASNVVTASSKSVYSKKITKAEAKKYKYYKKNYYKFGAKGSVTAKNKHYANVQLIEGLTGTVLASSGRQWGKGTVSVDTGYCTTYCCLIVDPDLQYATIWYGF